MALPQQGQAPGSHTCRVISAARLKVPSTPLTPKQSTTFCVSLKGTRSGISSTSPRSNRQPKSTCSVSPAHREEHSKHSLPFRCLQRTFMQKGVEATLRQLNAALNQTAQPDDTTQAHAVVCRQEQQGRKCHQEQQQGTPVRQSIMMFSPCLSPRPSTWPTMAHAALVRVKASRAASHVPAVRGSEAAGQRLSLSVGGAHPALTAP